MKQNITFSFYDAQLPQDKINDYHKQLQNYLQQVVSDEQLLNQTFPFIESLYDEQLVKKVAQVHKELVKNNPKVIVVVGIGGSNLGSRAVIELLYGTFYQESHVPTLFFADTTDPGYIKYIFDKARNVLEQDENICVIGISKSGKTIETIANFSVFTHLLKQYKKDTWYEHCVIISDKDSPFLRYAQNNNIRCLSIQPNVGGRYSVFTAGGLFPLLFAGVDVNEFVDGAQSVVQLINNNDIDELLRYIATLFVYYQSGQQLWNTFVFGHNFERYGKWWRQLVAESLAKEYTISGQKITHCLVPNISVGTVDLHSMVQLYLVGCAKQYTTFVTADEKNDIVVEPFKYAITQKTSLQNIMNAASTSMIKAYQDQQLAYAHMHLLRVSEETIGQLMMINMVQVVLLAHVMHVNAFDQPNVELYKKYMRAMVK
jgi:glucose-6-phosphate isomerase